MRKRLILPLLVLLCAALACNVPSAAAPRSGTADSVGAMLTQVAETVNAELTRTPGIYTSPTPEGAATTFPTLALIATSTPPGGTSALPEDTAAPEVCDSAAFVQDVSVPDGTLLLPGQAFTKTWRIRNTGTCTWTTGYAVVFVEGDALGAPAAVGLSGPVAPDAVVDLSVEMQAPAEEGSYTGFWRLRNAGGMQFGTGENQPFFVQIEVSRSTATPGGPTALPTPAPTGANTPGAAVTPASTPGTSISLAENFCEAEWRTQAGTLRCPGTLGSSIGYVVRPTSPQLESSAAVTGPVLLTVPYKATDGVITGQFPVMTILPGMRFRAELGCLNGVTGCSVVYQLNYVIGSGDPVSLGQWAHTYSGNLRSIDVDLSTLAGKQVHLILAVLANGPADGDLTVWVNPRIEQ